MWKSHLNHEEHTFENHYVIITLKRGTRHRKYDMEWNSFILEVSPRSETVRYLKSLISLREWMVVS